jgi:hypothetical protein
MRVSEVLCGPDTFENLRALLGIRFLCRRASFFTKLLWKLIYERHSGKKQNKDMACVFFNVTVMNVSACRLLTQSAVEVCMV